MCPITTAASFCPGILLCRLGQLPVTRVVQNNNRGYRVTGRLVLDAGASLGLALLTGDMYQGFGVRSKNVLAAARPVSRGSLRLTRKSDWQSKGEATGLKSLAITNILGN